jgi:hypothetical protein
MKKYKTRLLEPAENQKTKELYREVFFEDSQEFADYYYEVKAKENRIYVAEEGKQIQAMLHLNPYFVKLGAGEAYGEYVVAVATREKCRGQGMMSSLIGEALEDMRRIGEPFAFLMPAAEAIYRPFDFRFIYEQEQCTVSLKTEEKDALAWKIAEKEDWEEFEGAANKILDSGYETFAFHMKEYFEDTIREQRSQNGEVVLILEEDEICGYFFTTKENEIQVREPVIRKDLREKLLPTIADYLKNTEREVPEEITMCGLLPWSAPSGVTRRKKPMIMARLVEPTWFVRGMTAVERVEFIFHLEDKLLPENTGTYHLAIDQMGGHLTRSEKEPDFSLTAGDLTELCFGSRTWEELKLPTHLADAWKKVNTYGPVFLNEVV